jgi:S1-C subfamily serine protease
MRAAYLSIIVSLCVASVPPSGHAESSILASLMSTTQAVVAIKAEVGAIYGKKSKPFIHKESGRILVKNRLRPVMHTRHGTGVLISPDGLIVANAHTVVKAARITITLHDQSQHTAEMMHLDTEEDITLLKIKASHPFSFVKLTNSDRVKLDERVYSIGGSEMIRNTISEGVISGIGYSKSGQAQGQKGIGFLRVNFNIYQGDSGSPLLDRSGALLGIMAGAAVKRDRIAYAIPSKKILKAFQKYTSQTASSF